MMDALRWMRVVGDTVFAAGAIAFVVAVARLTLGRARGRSKSGADLDAAISV
jgi:nitric oxide reductase large subunit